MIGDEALLGTLDLYAIRAMPGEVLIGALPVLHGLTFVAGSPFGKRRIPGQCLAQC